MFDEACTKLELDEVASVLDDLNQKVEGSLFDPIETTILSTQVPFYPGYRFLSVADHASVPPLQRFAFQKEGTQDFTIIDWKYQTIYGLNAQVPVALSVENVLDYVRFFFLHVKGRHGRFVVCETADHIVWKDEPPVDVKKSINGVIHPLRLLDNREGGIFVISAFMMLKDALFEVQVYVDPAGTVSMSDHRIIMEDIPVMDTVFA